MTSVISKILAMVLFGTHYLGVGKSEGTEWWTRTKLIFNIFQSEDNPTASSSEKTTLVHITVATSTDTLDACSSLLSLTSTSGNITSPTEGAAGQKSTFSARCNRWLPQCDLVLIFNNCFHLSKLDTRALGGLKSMDLILLRTAHSKM